MGQIDNTPAGGNYVCPDCLGLQEQAGLEAKVIAHAEEAERVTMPGGSASFRASKSISKRLK
jgi:hypothetical protein